MSYLAGIDDVKGPGILGGILRDVRLDRDVAEYIFLTCLLYTSDAADE